MIDEVVEKCRFREIPGEGMILDRFMCEWP